MYHEPNRNTTHRVGHEQQNGAGQEGKQSEEPNKVQGPAGDIARLNTSSIGSERDQLNAGGGTDQGREQGRLIRVWR